jgi:hypothetical protein
MSRAHLNGKHGALPMSKSTRQRCLLMLRDLALSGNAVAAAELVKIGMLADEIAARSAIAADRPAA